MDQKLDLIVKSYAAELVGCVCESIRIPSLLAPGSASAPYGPEIAAAVAHAAAMAKNLGFGVTDLGGDVAWAEYGDGEEVVAAMGHLDIVAPGDGWNFDPYAGVVEDGYILGRGAQDDKGPVFGTLFALRAVADLGVPLRRKVRIIFGTDEENGRMRDVDAYLKNEGLPVMAFTPDGEYPIVNTEKGALKFKAQKCFSAKTAEGIRLFSIRGGEGLGSVPAEAHALLGGNLSQLFVAREKIEKHAAKNSWNVSCEICDGRMKVSVSGRAAHATLPELGENAAGRLLVLLSHLDIVGERGDYIHFLADAIGTDVKGTRLSIDARHPHSGSLTLNLGLIEGDEDSLEVWIGVYVPAGTRPFESVCFSLENAFSKYGAKIETIAKVPPMFMPEEHELIGKLKMAYFKATGEEPRLIGMCGSTYSKKMPNMVPFGSTFAGEDDRAHAANERLLVNNLLESTRIMAYAILEMAR